MKWITALLVLITAVSFAQDPTVKISGAIKYAENDTFTVTIISDQALISTEQYVGHFWTVYLFKDKNYFIIHQCGRERKVLTVDTHRMDMESIEIDVYFSQDNSGYIYLEKPHSKSYTLQIKSGNWIRETEIERVRTSF